VIDGFSFFRCLVACLIDSKSLSLSVGPKYGVGLL
jgi:hypothetical protein